MDQVARSSYLEVGDQGSNPRGGVPVRFEFFKKGDICGTYEKRGGDKGLTFSSSLNNYNRLLCNSSISWISIDRSSVPTQLCVGLQVPACACVHMLAHIALPNACTCCLT